jgi:hypothetical protein
MILLLIAVHILSLIYVFTKVSLLMRTSLLRFGGGLLACGLLGGCGSQNEEGLPSVPRVPRVHHALHVLGGEVVTTYQIEEDTGHLDRSSVLGVADAGNWGEALAADPAGRYVYVASRPTVFPSQADLHTVLTTRYFDELGVPRLQFVASTSRTARCGPARRVVWQGSPG